MKQFLLTGIRGATSIAAVTLLLLSCTSLDPLVVQSEPVQRIETDDYSIRIEFMDEAYLKALYGGRNNTFIAPDRVLNERFIVFDLELESKSDTYFQIEHSRIELSYEGRVARPQNRFHFGLFWEQQDQDLGSSTVHTRRRQNLINETLPPNTLEIESGSTDGGYLVYRGRFPQYGTAVINVPIRDLSGRPADRHAVEFRF